MRRIRGIIGGVVLLVTVVAPLPRPEAAEVRVFGETLPGFSLARVNDFYNGLAGHSSAILPSLTPGSLTGVELLWATQPADSYTAGEVAVMSAFLADGGRIAFLGEHGGLGAAQNTRSTWPWPRLGRTSRSTTRSSTSASGRRRSAMGRSSAMP